MLFRVTGNLHTMYSKILHISQVQYVSSHWRCNERRPYICSTVKGVQILDRAIFQRPIWMNGTHTTIVTPFHRAAPAQPPITKHQPGSEKLFEFVYILRHRGRNTIANRQIIDYITPTTSPWPAVCKQHSCSNQEEVTEAGLSRWSGL